MLKHYNGLSESKDAEKNELTLEKLETKYSMAQDESLKLLEPEHGYEVSYENLEFQMKGGDIKTLQPAPLNIAQSLSTKLELEKKQENFLELNT